MLIINSKSQILTKSLLTSKYAHEQTYFHVCYTILKDILLLLTVNKVISTSVSYTHLDVYKRQALQWHVTFHFP